MIYGKDSNAISGNEFIYNQVFRSIKDFAVILTDVHGTILGWNRGAEKIFSYKEAEIKGRNIIQLYKNSGKENLEKEMKAARQQQEYNFETIRVTKNNSPFIADVTISTVFDEDQNLFGYCFIIKDLTILKYDNISGYKLPEKLLKLNSDLEEEIELRIKIEGALREKEKEQLDLLEHAPVGIIWTSSSDEIKMVNKTLLDLWKYEKEDIAGKNISTLFARKDEAEILLADVKQGRIINNYRTVLLNRQGEYRNVSINTSVYSTNEHGHVHTRWYIKDITEKVIGEKAIAENERLGRILDYSSNEIYIFDCTTLKFNQVNRGALQNLGYTQDEIKDLTPLDLKPEYTYDEFMNIIKPLLSGELEILFFETIHKRKDGSLYPVEVRLQKNSSEDHPVFVAIILDITERKKSQRQLEMMLEETNVARDRAEQSAHKFILLARCNEILNSSMNYKTTLRNASKILIPGLADWIAIDLVDEQQNIYRESVQHADSNLKAVAKSLMRYGPVKSGGAAAVTVIETGKSLVFKNISKAEIRKNTRDEQHMNLALQMGIKSCVIVPLKVRNHVMGCLSLVYVKKIIQKKNFLWRKR
jgi:PAS domain S-box-containing protein